MPVREVPTRFAVAFSLAEVQRQLVLPIAQEVEAIVGRSTVFYDNWYEHWIAGWEADLLLQRLYGGMAELIVLCVGGTYDKPWTRAEHRAVRARLMQAARAEDHHRIFPVRVGDGEVEGALFNEIVPDVRNRTAVEAAELIVARLNLVRAEKQTERYRLVASLSAMEVGARQETQAQAPQPKIFLCYRREDTQGFARGIYESLASKYSHEQVFRDIDSTPAGVRYSTWIESRVAQCSVIVVLIGNAWLSAKDRDGHRRLDLPKDWVRQEIEVALRRDIPIIPVRVQGAPMPSEDELPSSIADLAGFQSAEVTDSRWAFDVGLLIQAIDNLIVSD